MYKEEYAKFNEIDGIQVHPFLSEIDLAYAASDFIISRAGASSISELCVVGKPTILIPSPNVSEDHQTKNAMALVKNMAAILLKESEVDSFQKIFLGLLKDVTLQTKLSENIKKLALPDATKSIVNQIEKLIELHKTS
jgi:UDP-N-acetylglucosamine--N-acetylmuramyl-(pentapeptide) pyrophosphoryl-undecaprenol N-acetylglucosamine transferase